MKLSLSANISKLRKEHAMTQEQLAEALGVSFASVSKWERGVATPELNLIAGMADLFGVSLDALVGYEMQNGSVIALEERIHQLQREKKYDEAITEAEKALLRYPNDFRIVYRAGELYAAASIEQINEKLLHRCIELLEQSILLLSQNSDPDLSEVSIRTQIAKAHLLLNNPETALLILKKYNVCGMNNAMIGMVLGDYLHDADGAEKYLGKAFTAFADEINDIMVGYANVFFQRKNYDAVIECFRWLRTVLRGLQPQTELTWFDKYDCVILETIAECYCFKGDFEKAKDYLKDAVIKAVRYDHASPGEVGGMKFYTMLKIEKQPNYDLYGKTAMDGLTRRMQPEDEGVPKLWKLWLEVTQEVLENETV